MSLFKEERKILAGFLEVNRSGMNDEVIEIFDTFIELITRYPEFVGDFDLEKLHDFMSEKAESFYEQFNSLDDLVTVEKNVVYIYSYQSISFRYGPVTYLYPFMLIRALNYRNFMNLLCRKLGKIDSRKITLGDFVVTFSDLLRRAKAKIDRWDVELLKELSDYEFSKHDYFKTFRRFENKKRFRRLKYLRVQNYYHGINYPAIDMVPYMHLTDHKTVIPGYLLPYIEKEDYPEYRQRNYKIFRLFLLPARCESKWGSVLNKLGATGRVEDWYITHNWSNLKQTTRKTWKWDIDIKDFSPFPLTEQRIYNRISKKLDSDKLTEGFITYLEAVHHQKSTRSDDLSAITGISEHTIRKYSQRALNGNFIIPYWLFARIGLDKNYQVCLSSNSKNKRLVRFLDSFPKVKVMKSRNFYRYLLFLPSATVKQLAKQLDEGEIREEFDILWKKDVIICKETIMDGVNLIETWEKEKKYGRLVNVQLS